MIQTNQTGLEPHHRDSCPSCKPDAAEPPVKVVNQSHSWSVQYEFCCGHCGHVWRCAFSRRVSVRPSK
jgi:uncharacterized Zn finger protein